MGGFSFTYADRSPLVNPAVRARVELSRKRFHCDLLGFWRQCKPKCRQGHRCLGDPHRCFSRHHARMPRDHAVWLHAAILSKTTGTATAERVLGAVGLSLPGRNKVDDTGVSPPQRANAVLVPAAAAARAEASRRAASGPEAPSQSRSEIVARVEKLLGMSLTGKLEPEPADAPPSPPASPQADQEAPVVPPKSATRAAVEAFDERARKGMDYNDLMARLRALGRSV
ncbi:MAG: hypothetical protein K2Y27_21695 [Xanthobacteraceae bacterium]|nr:hypothetical protein [Xanthobacteraceae bacterium]